MKVLKLLIAWLCLGWLPGCGPEPATDPTILAVATLYRASGSADSTLTVTDEEIGGAIFTQKDGVVDVQINITGLTPETRHAMFIYQGTCETPGQHWNQGTQADFCREPNLSLNDAWSKPHAGDIGNLRTGANGAATYELSTTFWRLGSGDNFDITGLVLIIHEQEVDFPKECFQAHDHPEPNPVAACGTINLITNDE